MNPKQGNPTFSYHSFYVEPIEKFDQRDLYNRCKYTHQIVQHVLPRDQVQLYIYNKNK